MTGTAFGMVLAAMVGLLASAFAVEEIPAHQAKKIQEAAPEKPRVAPKKDRTVLVWNTPPHIYAKGDPHKGYCVPYGAAALKALGLKSGAFQPVVSDDLANFLPENIKKFDAIVMNNSCGAWITPSDADMEKDAFKKLGADKAAIEQVLRQTLLEYVADGGGIVALHFAIGANGHWPAFQELLGGKFIGHPWNEEIGIEVEERDHPLVAAFEGKDFRLADEIYTFGKPYDRAKLRVLMSVALDRTNMGAKWIPWNERADYDFALTWAKSVGKGRIFFTSFGHRTELFWGPRILQLYLDAIQFATGDLAAPTDPRPDRPVRKGPGPTPPEVREAKMKEKGVGAPTAEQLKQIEAAAPDAAPARPAKPRKVLVWGHSWTHTPNAFAEEALKILARKTKAFEVTVTDDPRLLIADALPRFDAIVMNNVHEPEPFLPESFAKLTPEQQEAARKCDQAIKQSILEFVKGGKEPGPAGKAIPGKGIIGIHAATAAFGNWPEYGEMMGGFYGGHILQDVVIKLDDAQHPVNACFEGKPLKINDEIYIFKEPYSREKLRVLLSLDVAQMADPGKRPDKDYAVSWVRQYGDGRVFYTTLGHVEATYWNPQFLRHLLAGIQFATGDLPAEAAPVAKGQ